MDREGRRAADTALPQGPSDLVRAPGCQQRSRCLGHDTPGSRVPLAQVRATADVSRVGLRVEPLNLHDAKGVLLWVVSFTGVGRCWELLCGRGAGGLLREGDLVCGLRSSTEQGADPRTGFQVNPQFTLKPWFRL